MYLFHNSKIYLDHISLIVSSKTLILDAIESLWCLELKSSTNPLLLHQWSLFVSTLTSYIMIGTRALIWESLVPNMCFLKLGVTEKIWHLPSWFLNNSFPLTECWAATIISDKKVSISCFVISIIFLYNFFTLSTLISLHKFLFHCSNWANKSSSHNINIALGSDFLKKYKWSLTPQNPSSSITSSFTSFATFQAISSTPALPTFTIVPSGPSMFFQKNGKSSDVYFLVAFHHPQKNCKINLRDFDPALKPCPHYQIKPLMLHLH